MSDLNSSGKAYVSIINNDATLFFVPQRERATMTLLKGDITKFQSYSNFKNLEDFNNQFEMWMTEVKGKFTATELIAIKRVVRYSAKVAGVCNAGLKTLVAATKEHDVPEHGVSLSSLRRAIKKAVAIGLLEVKNTIRKDNSQSTNLYIFKAFNCPIIEQGSEVQESPESPTNQQTIVDQLNTLKTSNIFKTSNIKNNINTYNTAIKKNEVQQPAEIKDVPKECKLSFNEMNLYQKMQHLLKNTVGHTNDLKEYSKVVYGNINSFLKHGFADQREVVEDIAYRSIKRIVHLKDYAANPFGLLHYNLNQELDKLAERLIYDARKEALDEMNIDESNIQGPDWLYSY